MPVPYLPRYLLPQEHQSLPTVHWGIQTLETTLHCRLPSKPSTKVDRVAFLSHWRSARGWYLARELVDGDLNPTGLMGSEASLQHENTLTLGNTQASERAQPEVSTALPSFFVIGPPRTGTTWLHAVLRQSTLLPHPAKETRFFDSHFQRGFDWYRAHYPARSDNRPMAEVAPTYFASPEARERLVKAVPHAKVACIFRNPVERVVSLYRLKRAYGMIPWSFEQAVFRDPEMLESGRYATNLKAWKAMLSDEQILPLVYDDLRSQPQAFVDDLADFIGVPRFTLTAGQMSYVFASERMTHPRSYLRTRSATALADWCKARQLHGVVEAVKDSPLIKLFLGGGPAFSQLSPEVSQRLYEIFRPEVEELETLLNRDFSSWKSWNSF